MKELIRKKLNIPSYYMMLFLSFSFACFFTFMYWTSDFQLNPKASALYAGFASAFLVAFMQLFTSIYDAYKLNKFESMGITEILDERRDYKRYEKLIVDSKNVILVIGVTSSRFLNDFASSNTSNNVALIEALARGVNVRILLPKLKHLSNEKQSKLIGTTLRIYEEIREKYDNIEIRFFNHIPLHSLVVFDNTCIAGPVFEEKESMYTPALVLKSDSKYAAIYMDNFEHEWKLAENNAE